MKQNFESYIHDDKKVDFYCVSGEVIDTKKSSQTHVSSSGGMPFASSNGKAEYTPVRVSSYVVDTQEFWIAQDDGTETCVKLTNNNVDLRVGHNVTLISATTEASKYRYHVALINHTQKSVKRFLTGSELNVELRIFRMRGVTFLCTIFVFLLFIFFFSIETTALISCMVPIIGFIIRVKKVSQFVRGLDKHINSLVDRF